MRTYTPLVEKGPFAFLIDKELNHDKERWQEIESYVRRNAPKDFRLLDKLADMAKPLAKDVHSELDLEPEDMLIIPLPKVEAAKEPEAATVEVAPKANYTCPKCNKEFKNEQGLFIHQSRMHKKELVSA
jgi:hypothetical protein